MRLNEGLFLAVFRGEGQALCLHFRRGWCYYALALDCDLSAVAGVCAEEGAQQFGTAGTQHPGNAEDFALVEREAHIGEGVPARQALHL